MSALLVKGLSIHYGGIEAVKSISLELRSGELVALIGANGAGKTSTLKAIAGLIAVEQGEILLNGHDLLVEPVYRRSTLGLALVPEGRGVFPRMSVLENLMMGAFIRHDPGISEDLIRVYEYFPRLKERQQQKAGTLSGGEQQMLAMGRALMSRPQVLLLDEPSMGLAPLMVQTIFAVIRDISRSGVSILLVEQNARLALKTAERAYVMESGRISFSGESRACLDNPRIQTAYLGGHARSLSP
jgi:branched-chain amino acid transport system ATP-binding protein